MTYRKTATLASDALLVELGSGPEGLAPAIARDRLSRDGENRLTRRAPGTGAVLARQLISPLTLVLFAAVGVASALADWASAITISVFLAVNVALGFIQEFRSERVVTALERYIAPSVRVRRGGAWVRVETAEVVPGDVIALSAGDAFPADARIVRAERALVDESILTGESAPTPKTSDRLRREPGAPHEASNIGFAGTTLAAGTVEAVVFSTGDRTALGAIAREAAAVKRPSVFEQNIGSFSRFLVKAVVVTLALVYAANLLIKGAAADAGELLLFSLALAVSVIPEALPTVITVTFSRGALMLAKKKVVVKRLSAIEDLGHIEVLCTDKTGTLTENKLTVGRLSAADPNALVSAALDSAEQLDGRLAETVSSFDAALWRFASADQRADAEQVPRVASVPFDPIRRRNATVVERAGKRYLTVKGAPEDIVALAGLEGPARERVMSEFRGMGAEGMRVLALARRVVPLQDAYGAEDESGAAFIGLVGFIDPLKRSAKSSVEHARRLNVRVKIVTGDAVEVAAAIGVQLGIIGAADEAVEGTALARLGPREFAEAVERADVIARVAPEQKLHIVSVLEERHATGFLGEGVNDAPALKAANVALVVSGAADVSREAADVVLLEKSLRVVVDGIRAGRTIYGNVLKYIKYTLVGNFGNFYAIALISLFIDFLPMTPVQLLLVNLLTDFPLVAVATDTVDEHELAAPRRFSVRDVALMTTVLGLVSSVFDFIVFGIYRHASPEVLQTAWFMMSVATEIAVIFVLRTNRPFYAARRASVPLIALSALACLIAFVIPFIPWGRTVFGFVVPSAVMLATVAGIALAYLVSTEAAKRAYLRLIHSFARPNG